MWVNLRRVKLSLKGKKTTHTFGDIRNGDAFIVVQTISMYNITISGVSVYAEGKYRCTYIPQNNFASISYDVIRNMMWWLCLSYISFPHAHLYRWKYVC